MKQIFELALHIKSPWYIKNIEFIEKDKRLNIYIDFKRGSLFEYKDSDGNVLGKFKAFDTTNKKWRHLNFFEHECYLHARVPRVKLDNGKVKLIKTPWEGLSNGFTMLFEALIMQLMAHMPVLKISQLVNVSDDKLWRMLHAYIEKARQNQDFSDIEAIGMDETSRCKGHDYITLFVDMKERKTIFITEGKDSQTVAKFKDDFEKHNGDIEKIEDVSCDMSPAFVKGITENLPNAEITFDKFHIIKKVNEAVSEVRKNEAKTNPILKKSRFVVLKNRKNLTQKEKLKLDELSLPKLNLKTIKAYHIRESFQEIYKAETHEKFEQLLKKWYYWATHSRIKPIIKVAKTIKKHWNGVLRWYKSRINNGILEGLNSVIQAAKSKARGYKTTKNLIAIAYLKTAKFDFSEFNKYYLPI